MKTTPVFLTTMAIICFGMFFTRNVSAACIAMSGNHGRGSGIVWEACEYRSAVDSPFYAGIKKGTILLEDFEDQELDFDNVFIPQRRFPNTQGIATSLTSLTPSSVDGDGGVLDNRSSGDSFTMITPGFESNGSSIEFATFAGGNFPTYIGFVVTEMLRGVSLEVDITVVGGESVGDPFYDDFDDITLAIVDSSNPEDTVDDRFYGFYHPQGFKEIEVGGARQIDHLQIGWAIPEPGPVTLLMCSVCYGLGFRRRANTCLI